MRRGRAEQLQPLGAAATLLLSGFVYEYYKQILLCRKLVLL